MLSQFSLMHIYTHTHYMVEILCSQKTEDQNTVESATEETRPHYQMTEPNQSFLRVILFSLNRAPSKPYKPPPAKTKAAPKRTPGASWFPKR